MMVRSGLPDQCWNYAVECECHVRNVRANMADGITAVRTKYLLYILAFFFSPSGAKVSYKPTPSKDEARLHPFRNKMILGIFMGYVSRAGAG